jgi:hypothetical protein
MAVTQVDFVAVNALNLLIFEKWLRFLAPQPPSFSTHQNKFAYCEL